MGKQMSIYLEEDLARRLAARAINECRSPREQARYILRSVLLGEQENENRHDLQSVESRQVTAVGS